MQAWALNRYCYQAAVPRKDAALMSRVLDRELRREWVHRMLDHDGGGGEEGGIERWLVLTDALGLDRDYVVSMRGRAAGHALRGGGLRRLRARAAAAGGGGLLADRAVRADDPSRSASPACWRATTSSASGRCSTSAAASTRPTATPISRSTTSSATPRTPEQQAAAVDAVRFKCNVLWAQLDALHHAYVDARR